MSRGYSGAVGKRSATALNNERGTGPGPEYAMLPAAQAEYRAIQRTPDKPEHAAQGKNLTGIAGKRGSRLAQDRLFRAGQGFGQGGLNLPIRPAPLGSPQTIPATSPPGPDIRRGGQFEATSQENEAPEWPRTDCFGWGKGSDRGKLPDPAYVPWQPSETQNNRRE